VTDFLFAPETKDSLPAWKVMIIDDEPEVHNVTRLVLGNFRFEDRGIEFVHAYSAGEAREKLRAHGDVAVLLLDVVMETEQAGLDLVRFVREELENHFVRIVLRTGQPGQAPEQEVIANYDINDYKEKTELTAQKLSTMMYATLRAHRDIMTIEAHKRGLERVIEASAKIFSLHESHEFASAVLGQLTNLMSMERGALYCKVMKPATAAPDHFVVAAATGEYRRFVNANADESLPPQIADSLRAAYFNKGHRFARDHYVLHFTDSHRTESLLYVGEAWDLSPMDMKLVEVFCTNVSIAFENLHLQRELFEGQVEMVTLLAGLAETRSRETLAHVKRVGRVADLLGEAWGLDAQAREMLRYAAPLHDIGKIGIPDAILNKPGAHTPAETEVMRSHATLGANWLSGSRLPLLQLAAIVAEDHHENWDGSGYPRGLKGEEISIGGRITALADVFDALGSKRCYKEAWAEQDIRAFIQGQSGVKFDPRLVEILFAHWDQANDIRRQMPD
jgi:response regulator RpfG family c-di-GMP phosphodiesterase